MRRATLGLLILGAVLSLTLAVVRLTDPAPVSDLRLASFDYLQRLSPRPYEPIGVRIIDIDETSLNALGQWPWPRRLMAMLSDRLEAAGAAVVVHDILYAEPDRLSPNRILDERGGERLDDYDAELARAVALVPTVLGTARVGAGEGVPPPTKAGIVEVGETPVGALPRAERFTPIVPVLAEAARGVGVISVGPDGGGPVRRLPLVWSGPEGVVPSLSVEALRIALGSPSITLWGSPDLSAMLEGVEVGGVFAPTASNGEMWLRARRDVAEVYVPAIRILGDPVEEWVHLVEGHIVLIGTSAAGLLDIRTTSLGETVPGVSIHAQAIEQMLLGDHLTRSDVTGGLEILAFLALASAITLSVAFAGPAVALGVGGLGGTAVLTASWLAFTGRGVLFDPSFPVLAGGVLFAALAAWRLVIVDRERRLIRRSFAHYVAPEVIGEIERRGHNLSLGGEARDVTIMFSDLRGFTALSESLAPEETVALLNTLFDAFGAEIMAERGTIDKFIGDAVMAFWNAPLPVENHPARAVATALRMRAALGRFNAGRPTMPPLRLAIGIATGPASVGNIGSANRFNYSVIGDTVNLAARVEAACRSVGAGMLVTDEVARACEGLALLDAGRLDFKGVSRRVRVWVVVGGEGYSSDPRFAALSALHATLTGALARSQALPVGTLAEARELADALHPSLADFYDALPSRAEDYRP